MKAAAGKTAGATDTFAGRFAELEPGLAQIVAAIFVAVLMSLSAVSLPGEISFISSVLADGFLPKASALFKKILKIRPEDEHSMLRLGQIAAKQGLLELRSENARLRLVTRLFRAATKRLDFIERAQVRARSNGKVRFG